MRLIFSERFSFEKCGKTWKNWPFFQADMAGLGKYCTGGYGRIVVYRAHLGIVIPAVIIFHSSRCILAVT